MRIKIGENQYADITEEQLKQLEGKPFKDLDGKTVGKVIKVNIDNPKHANFIIKMEKK